MGNGTYTGILVIHGLFLFFSVHWRNIFNLKAAFTANQLKYAER